MKDTLLKSAIGLSLLQASSLAVALSVTFTEVPDIKPSLLGQKPLAISNDGTVAMMSTDYKLIQWNAITGTELIYSAPGFTGTNAIWPTISEDGNTILFSSFSESSDNSGQDYYYHDGEVTVYNHSPSGTLIPNLYAMSGDGSIMGGYHSNWEGDWPATLTAEDQFNKHLNAPENTIIAAINMDGTKFVGSKYSNGISSNPATAYVWEAGATPVASDISMTINGFSASGDVVLGSVSEGYFGPNYSVLWNVSSNQYTYINDIPYPKAFSDNTSIVVGNSKNAQNNSNTMLIWDNVNGVRSLNDVLTSYGVNLAGWSALTIQNISRDGTKMVGSGINPEGQTRAFIINTIDECSPFL